MVQLESIANSPPTLRARVTLPLVASRQETLQNPKQFHSLLRNALAADRFHGRNAIVAVPSGLFRTVSINYQAGTEHDDANAVLRIMRDRLDGDIADFVLDYLPVKSRSKTNERLALVAVSEREPIVALLESLRKSGINVEALEIGPVAISRLVGAVSNAGEHENVLVINSGREASYLTLISGTDLLFDQQVRFGETVLISQLAGTLEMSQEMARDLLERSGVRNSGDSPEKVAYDHSLVTAMSEILKPQFLKLVEEIKRVCLYAAAETRGGAVSKLYLLGSIARWPGADYLLGSMAGVAVAKIPDPLERFANANEPGYASAHSIAPEIAVATGLALRGLNRRG